MVLQSLRRRRVGRTAPESGDARLRRATAHAVEALEARRLLSLTPAQVAYTWEHLTPSQHHLIAVSEYVYPEFAEKLTEQLLDLGLTPIEPEVGNLDSMADAAKGRNHVHPHKLPHHPHPKPRQHAHGKDGQQSPHVTDTNYYYNQALPNQVAFTFDQNVDQIPGQTSTDWARALTVVDLNTAQPVTATFNHYVSGLNTAIYDLSPNELTRGNYAAVLDGTKVRSVADPSKTLVGSDGLPGGDVVKGFYFNDGELELLETKRTVGLDDFTTVVRNFGRPEPYQLGDVDYTGTVGLGDYTRVVTNYGKPVASLTSPAIPTLSQAGPTSVQISWTTPNDSRVATYDVYRDSALLQSDVTTTSYTDTTLVAGVPHKYFVVARGGTGSAWAGSDSSYPSDELTATTSPRALSPVLDTSTSVPTLSFPFDRQMTSGDWNAAVTLLNLDTGQPVAAAGVYDGATRTVTYTLNGGTTLPDANYVGVLHGADVAGALDGVLLTGTDGVAGHDVVYDFFFSSGGGGRSGPAAAPGGPAATSVTNASIALSWSAPAGQTVVGYDLYRNFARIATSSTLTGTSFTDAGLAGATTYAYFVVARDAAGHSSYVSPIVLAATVAPEADKPLNLHVLQNAPNRVVLAWTGNDLHAVTYTIHRRIGQDPADTATANITSAAFTDTTVTPGTEYHYSVEAVNASSIGSVRSDELTVVTPQALGNLPFGYALTPPSAPLNLQYADTSTSSASSVTLTWSPPASGGAAMYEIDRDGVAVGGVLATTFTDNDVTAGLDYSYKVLALNSTYDASPPATLSNPLPPLPDHIAPAAPVDLQASVSGGVVTLNWVRPGDDVGVTGYHVTRKLGLQSTTFTTTSPAYQDSSATAGQTYTYTVSALDAAGNETEEVADQMGQPGKHRPSVTVAVPGTMAASPVDTAPNQYIPPEWQDDFYDNLTAVLRQRMAAVPGVTLTPPAAARWYNSLDVVISGVPPTSSQIHGSGNDYAYFDSDGNGVWTLLGSNSSNYATSGEAVWLDSNHNQRYDQGETIVFAGTEAPTDGTPGRTNGITGTVGAGAVVWQNGTSFAQDFVAFYPALTQLLYYYDSRANSNMNWSADRLSVGQLFGPSVGPSHRITIANETIAAPVANAGSITATLTATSGHLRQELLDEDCVQIDGIWYPVASFTDTQINLARPYYGHGGSWPLVVCNWTTVPDATDGWTNATYHYQRGMPGMGQLVFKEQFDELHTALGALNQLAPFYGQSYFGSDSSRYLGVATDVINAYESVFGVTHATAQYGNLLSNIMRGDADAAALYDAQLVNGLHPLVDALEAKIYVRVGNAWATDSQGRPLTFANDLPLLQELLPAVTNTLSGQTMRVAGQWSTFGNGSFIDHEHLDEIERVLTRMKPGQVDPVSHTPVSDQALWIQQTDESPAIKTRYTGFDSFGDYVGGPVVDVKYPDAPTPQHWHVDPYDQSYIVTPDDSANRYPSLAYGLGVGVLQFQRSVIFNSAAASTAEMSYAHLRETSGEAATNLGSSHNALGGSDVQGVLLGPGNDPSISASGLQWNRFNVLFTWNEQDVLSQLMSGYDLSVGAADGQGNAKNPQIGENLGGQLTKGLSRAWHYYVHFSTSTGSYENDTFSETAYFNYPAIVGNVYGSVPLGGTFNYSPDPSHPGNLPNAPGGSGWLSVGGAPDSAAHPLPLTTEMDYRNVQADTNADGIVELPVDVTSFGNDTGVMAFQADRKAAQAYLPVFTIDTLAIPINGYFLQGAFADDQADGKLMVTDRESAAAHGMFTTNDAAAGLPFFFSLDSYVRENVLIDDAVNHVKRVEVIRPGGNAVVFDFAWDADNHRYSTLGLPLGWNNRDTKRTYVLRDLKGGRDESKSYALEFASGVVQTFANNKLVSVSDASGLTAQVPDSGFSHTGDRTNSNRYNVTLHWSGGKITSVDYTTRASNNGPSAQTITTTVQYDPAKPNLITSLGKKVGAADIPEFSYALNGATITRGTSTDGVDVSRTGTSTVVLTTTPHGADSIAVGSSLAETVVFNSSGMVTSDSVVLDGQQATAAVTSYLYYPGTARSTVNGSAPWGRVRKVTYPDQSWAGYKYDADTGWLTEAFTPFGSNAWSASPEASSVTHYYEYAPAFTGAGGAAGEAADPLRLVERPRLVTDTILDEFVGGTLYEYNGATVTSRRAPTEDDVYAWNHGVFQTKTTVTAYNKSKSVGVGGTVVADATTDGSSKQTTQTLKQMYGGNTLAIRTLVSNAFGNAVSDEGKAVGAVYTMDSVTGSSGADLDAFGRVLRDKASGGTGGNFTYDPSVSWFGPATVTEHDGSTTKYTYAPTGAVATKLIYANSPNHAVKYAWQYDAAGHVVRLTTVPVDAAGNPTGTQVVNTYSYDGKGRITEEKDNAGGDTSDPTHDRTTEYAYDLVNSHNVQTITYPDSSTEVVTRHLDGRMISDTGTAVTPSYYDAGVVPGDYIDAGGRTDTHVWAGSTWSSVTGVGGSANTTITYTDTLGETYLTQKTLPGSTGGAGGAAMADAVTSFDGNGRAIKYLGFDGAQTLTAYDPLTGQIASSVEDDNHDGQYTPGVDGKSVSRPVVLDASGNPVESVALPAAGAVATVEAQSLAVKGGDDELDAEQLTDSGPDAGSDVKQTVNKLTTETKTSAPANGGWTSTTTNPDGTSVVDVYADGLLTSQTTRGTSPSTTITLISFAYDNLRRLVSKTDYRGTTLYTYFQDGTQKSVQEPGHNAVEVNTIDTRTNASTQDHRADGGAVNTPQNARGQTSAAQGAGVLPAAYGYDTGGTGQLTSLTTYRGAATLNGAGGITGAGDTTTWAYDQATGLLKGKTYADGAAGREQYQYNGKFQLSGVVKPGIVGSGFAYDAAGRLTSKSLTDSTTGAVSTNVAGYDEMGRPVAVTDTDNGKTYMTGFAYDALGRPESVQFGSADGARVAYDYYASANYGHDGYVATGSPGARSGMQVTDPVGNVLSNTTYAYSTDDKRLSTITVNGINFAISYLTHTDLVSQVIASPGATPSQQVKTIYTQDASDTARLRQIDVSTNNIHPLTDTVTSDANGHINYSQQDQITGRTTTTVAKDSSTTVTSTATQAYTYNAALGDALTGVSGNLHVLTEAGPGNTTATNTPIAATYGFDNAGNFTGTPLGAANNLNQYPTLTYNSRGDVTDDGTYAYAYDANDRLVRVTPHDTSKPQVKYGYDAAGHRLWKDVYVYGGGAWTLVPSSSRHYLWDEDHLIAELAPQASGPDKLVTGYTWGPTGLLAATDYTPAGGPVTYVVVADLSGNVVELLDAGTGAVGAIYTYDAWGNMTGASGAAANVCSFRGKGLLVDPETPDIQHALHRDARQNLWLERDPADELQGGVNLHQMYGGDPINKSDPSGLATRAQDPQAELPGFRSTTQVWNEAKEAIRLDTGLGSNTPWGQVVSTGIFGITTYGDLVTKSYKAKVDWYFNNPFRFVVESDKAYLQDVEEYYATHQVTISADTRTPDQIAEAERISKLKRDVANGSAIPQALQAAQIAQRHDSLWAALFDAAGEVAPELAAGYASLKSPGSGFSSPRMLARRASAPSPDEGALYDVGLAKDLRANPVQYTQVHHVGQSAQAESLLGDFNGANKVGNEPSIRIAESEHAAINADQVNYSTPVSARHLLSRDIRLLRNNTDAPNSALKELIDLNIKLHPTDYRPLPK